MVVTKIEKKLEDGTLEVKFALTEEQTAFLINFAIGTLVQQGVISFAGQDVSQDEKDFLANVDPSTLGKAQ
jgi:hypothetical protein